MSILCSNDKGWVISHYDYSKNLYKNVHSLTGNIDLAYNKSIFKITAPFLRDKEAEKLAASLSSGSLKKVRKRNFMSGDDEVQLAQKALKSLLEEARSISYFQSSVTPLDILENNASARSFVNGFYELPFTKEKELKQCIDSFEGGNNKPSSKIVEINSNSYVMPPYSTFVCCDVNEFSFKQTKKFDFILIDPPWRNKHVRRKKRNCSCKGYEMMDDIDILKIPVKMYMENNGLVGIWCTNASRHIEAIKQSYFPEWGLDYIATWLWIKVTESGEPVCSFFTKNGKKPYERIIFGAPLNRPTRNPEELKCILSIPSAVHSHKPPIAEIMKNYLPENANCLELFARYLLPGWTSVGNEVILLQSLNLFECVNVT